MAERGGLPWYHLWTDFPVHPKTVALCAKLRDDNAGMYVIRLFSHCAEYALDGIIEADVVEGAANWRRRRGALLAALVATGALEARDGGRYEVHGWVERNGARIREWLRCNAKRKPTGNPGAAPADTPQDSREEPRENPAGFSGGTPEEPRGLDGRQKTEKKQKRSPPAHATRATGAAPEAATSPPSPGERVAGDDGGTTRSTDGGRHAAPSGDARAALGPEAPAEGGPPAPAAPRTPAAAAADDLPRRELAVEDYAEQRGPDGTFPSTGRLSPVPRRGELAGTLRAEDWPLTAQVLEQLRARGWVEAEWPKTRSAGHTVEAAIRVATVDVAVERLLAMAAAERARGLEPKPWLGWHEDVILARPGRGAAPRDIRVGFADPAPADQHEEGEHELRM